MLAATIVTSAMSSWFSARGKGKAPTASAPAASKLGLNKEAIAAARRQADGEGRSSLFNKAPPPAAADAKPKPHLTWDKDVDGKPAPLLQSQARP